MIRRRVRFLLPLVVVMTLSAGVAVPSARALDPLSKLHKKIFGDDDDDKKKETDKERKKRKEREEDERRRYANHTHYDRNGDGYCDVCGTTIVVARPPAVVIERRPYGEPPPPPRYGYGEYSRRSPSVEADVQLALRRRGYYRGPADGEFGPGTRAAIENFQYDYGLPVSGRIDRNLLNYLGL